MRPASRGAGDAAGGRGAQDDNRSKVTTLMAIAAQATAPAANSAASSAAARAVPGMASTAASVKKTVGTTSAPPRLLAVRKSFARRLISSAPLAEKESAEKRSAPSASTSG